MKNAIIVIAALAIIALVAFFVVKPKSKTDNTKAVDASFSVTKLGSDSAPVKMVEVSNYTCSHCARHANEILPRLISDYVDTGKVQISFQDFTNNPVGIKAAEAASCARDQDKFLDFHYALFRGFNELTGQSETSVVDFLKGLAPQLGLDANTFNSCLDKGQYTQHVRDSSANAVDIGLTGTPFFVTNGDKISGEKSYNEWQKYLDEKITKATAKPDTKPSK